MLTLTLLCMQAQSRALNELLSSHGHHARQVVLHGGGWVLLELQTVVGSLTRRGLRLCVTEVDAFMGAIALGAFLPPLPVQELHYCGAAPARAFPPSVTKLVVHDTIVDYWRGHVSHPEAQADKAATVSSEACVLDSSKLHFGVEQCLHEGT